MSKQPAFRWTSAERSHVGMVRTINEDACLARPDLGLWAVADGMGGHEAGDVASQMIVDTLGQLEPPTDWDSFLNAVRQGLCEVNQHLREQSAQRYQNRTIGSTVVVLLLRDTLSACLWVGDSRIYRLRDGQLQQITRDHSHVQELVDQGLISAAEAHRHPLANVITRAVGSAEELQVDQVIDTLQTEDTFLLCSDGLNKAVSDEEIAHFLTQSNGQCEEAVKALIHLALMREANDNVTTVMVRATANSADTAAETLHDPIPANWYLQS